MLSSNEALKELSRSYWERNVYKDLQIFDLKLKKYE